MDTLENIDLSHIDFNDKEIIKNIQKESLKNPKDVIDLPNGIYIFKGKTFNNENKLLDYLQDINNKVEFAQFRDGRVLVHSKLFKNIDKFKQYAELSKKLIHFINKIRRFFWLKPL